MEITAIKLQTSSLKELINFYRDVLELPIEIDGQSKIAIGIGRTALVFEQVKGADPFYHYAINIPCNKLDEARSWLFPRAALIWMDDYNSDIADFRNWNAKSVYFYDPAGNILELIARFDLDNKMDEPFSSAQFLCVSEMGVVTKLGELEDAANRLLKDYDLNYFTRQPPLPQFKAIGDNNGLFIVVPEKRNWYPTAKPGGIFPMNVQFINAGKKYELTE
ncbi:MAG TPA: hypothetical protein VFN95_15060 [Flavitalea sp.]|nr:hypothetical protein [Flavitalea sp.]